MPPKRVREAVSIKLGVGADASGLPETSKGAAALATSFPESGIMVVEPSDPPKLLDAHRLASRGENRERMWRVLSEHPRFEHDPPQKQRAIAEINRVASEETREGIFWALGLLLLITGNEELRPTLEPQLDALWTSIPQLTMWFVTAEEAFGSRVRLSQLLFQFQHTPDLDIETLMADERRSMWAQSLSNGISTAEKRRGPFQWGVSPPSCSTETKPDAEIVCQETAELQYNAVGHSATPINVCETKPGYYSPTECPVLEYPEVLSPAGEEHRVSLTISGSGVFDPLHPEAGQALCAHLEAAVHREPRSTREWELLGTSGPTCNVTV
jgi:hypothetical protein